MLNSLGDRKHSTIKKYYLPLIANEDETKILREQEIINAVKPTEQLQNQDQFVASLLTVNCNFKLSTI